MTKCSCCGLTTQLIHVKVEHCIKELKLKIVALENRLKAVSNLAKEIKEIAE